MTSLRRFSQIWLLNCVTDKTLTIKTKYNFFVITYNVFPLTSWHWKPSKSLHFQMFNFIFWQNFSNTKKDETFTFCNLFGTQLRRSIWSKSISSSAQYVTLQKKYFSNLIGLFIYLCIFPTPPIKLKLGLQRGEQCSVCDPCKNISHIPGLFIYLIFQLHP